MMNEFDFMKCVDTIHDMTDASRGDDVQSELKRLLGQSHDDFVEYFSDGQISCQVVDKKVLETQTIEYIEDKLNIPSYLKKNASLFKYDHNSLNLNQCVGAEQTTKVRNELYGKGILHVCDIDTS